MIEELNTALDLINTNYGRGKTTQLQKDAAGIFTVIRKITKIVHSIVTGNFSEYFGFNQDAIYQHRYIGNEIRYLRPNEVLVKPASQIKEFFNFSSKYLILAIQETLLNPEAKISMTEENIDEKIKSIREKADQSLEMKLSPEKTKEFLATIDTSIRKATPELESFVSAAMKKAFRFKPKSFKVWKVVDRFTEERYNRQVSKDGDRADEHLFWHGSANKNYQSILVKGLSTKLTRDGMFGRGIYFADLADKSFGYTSGDGSIWNHGDSKRCYLVVFKVNMGKSYATRGGDKYPPKGFDSISQSSLGISLLDGLVFG